MLTLGQPLAGSSLIPAHPRKWWMGRDILPAQTKPAEKYNMRKIIAPRSTTFPPTHFIKRENNVLKSLLTRTSFSESPLHLLTILDAEMLKNVVLHSVATALASIVFPVPDFWEAVVTLRLCYTQNEL